MQIFQLIREELTRDPVVRLAAALIKPSLSRIGKHVDFETYGDYAPPRPKTGEAFVRPTYQFQGRISADGSTLWLSGRYSAVVYAIDVHNGHLRATIPVGDGPHGLCVWPQPGRYSLGHTGVMR